MIPELLDAPQLSTTYVVEVRCSSDESCADSRHLSIIVNCPASGELGGIFQTIAAPDRDTLVWTHPVDGSFASGDLATVATYAFSNSAGFAAATALDISNDADVAQAQVVLSD